MTLGPVMLDLDFGSSSVIGDRAFSDEPEVIAALAGAFVAGLTAGGAASVGKHFPGHGYVKADSHVDVPVDVRGLGEIEAADLLPYRELIKQGLCGIMPAHVIYPEVDKRPAGFSPVWLKEVLRGRLGFGGMIFSDDLSMEGASVAGGVVQRAEAALAAGCDMVLVCNAPQAAAEVLHGLKAVPPDRAPAARRSAGLRAFHLRPAQLIDSGRAAERGAPSRGDWRHRLGGDQSPGDAFACCG